MKHIRFFIFLMAMVAFGAASAQTTDEDAALRQKINAAVMKVYDDDLAKDPTDYNTRFARANQLYYNGDLTRALADVTECINATPESETDLRYDQLLLRAKIYDVTKQYASEQADLKQALSINPSNLAGVDMMAKLALNQGDYATAESNFNAILRQAPQNYDALYGLARVEAKRSNWDKAQEYANRAVSLFPAEQQVYLNRADVYAMMGQYQPAAQDLIIAMSVSNNQQKAVSQLLAMSDTHYDAVMKALQTSIDNAPRVGTFPYLRATVAMRRLHYGQALKNLNSIINNQLSNDYSVYFDQARCLFELQRYDEALEAVNKGLENKTDDPEAYVLKAQILEHQGQGANYDAALEALKAGEQVRAAYVPNQLAQARILVAKRQNDEALALLNDIIAANPRNNEALLLRGWVNKYRLRNAEAGLADFGLAVNNGSDLASLKGFALHELGRDDEARTWAQDIIRDNVLPGGEAYACASALLSDIGDTDQAVKYLESALANGYGSLFEVMTNVDPYVNLKLVRRAPDFQTLVDRYKTNFTEHE